MATLRAHKGEVSRIETVRWTRVFCADGTVLKNDGFGYKLDGRIKPGFTPQSAAQSWQSKINAKLAPRPAYRAYRELMLDVPLSIRWKLRAALELMPNDPDGVWSEACDGYDNVDLSLDEVVQYCRAYLTMEAEAKELMTEEQE